MQKPSYMHIGLLLTTEKPTTSLHAMVYSLIMRALEEGKHLLQEK